MNTPAKDWKQLRKRLAKLGCIIEPTSGAHYRIFWQGKQVATSQDTASSTRAFRNHIAELRRAGVPIGR